LFHDRCGRPWDFIVDPSPSCLAILIPQSSLPNGRPCCALERRSSKSDFLSGSFTNSIGWSSITIAYTSISPQYAPVWIAKEAGVFRKNGINAQVRSGQPIAAADCVVIEDSKEGIRGARRADMKCLAVTNSYPAELLADAVAVVKSLEGVNLNFLRQMCAWVLRSSRPTMRPEHSLNNSSRLSPRSLGLFGSH